MATKIMEIPKEFQPRFDELVKIETQLYDLKREQEIKTASLWRDVEIQFNLRGAILKYVQAKNHIEVIDTTEERDKEMLQRIREGKAVPVAHHPANLQATPMGSALPKVVFKKTSFWQRIKNSFKNDD